MTATLDAAARDPRQTIAALEAALRERTAERDEALAQRAASADRIMRGEEVVHIPDGHVTEAYRAGTFGRFSEFIVTLPRGRPAAAAR